MNQLKKWMAVAGLALTVIFNPGTMAAQHDPGPRPGAAAAGGSLPGLSSDLQSFFNDAMATFMEVDSVSGSISGESGSGLGPTFNGNSCAQCHAFPAVGGSSPASNPQVALATLDGALNTVPSFITTTARCGKLASSVTPTVRPMAGCMACSTIAGRTDAEGCNLKQPNFDSAAGRRERDFSDPHSNLRSGPGGSHA